MSRNPDSINTRRIITCKKCQHEKHHYANGHCWPCFLSEWGKKNRAKIRARRYGLTLEQVEQLKADQNGQCALCRITLVDDPRSNRGKDKMCIDHDHKTGRVRGLLCDVCNRGLGFYERMLTFPNLEEYLK